MRQFTKDTAGTEIPRSVLKGRSVKTAPGLPRSPALRESPVPTGLGYPLRPALRPPWGRERGTDKSRLLQAADAPRSRGPDPGAGAGRGQPSPGPAAPGTSSSRLHGASHRGKHKPPSILALPTAPGRTLAAVPAPERQARPQPARLRSARTGGPAPPPRGAAARKRGSSATNEQTHHLKENRPVRPT